MALPVIARSVSDESIQGRQSSFVPLECFAALAMTMGGSE